MSKFFSIAFFVIAGVWLVGSIVLAGADIVVPIPLSVVVVIGSVVAGALLRRRAHNRAASQRIDGGDIG